jgi:hypothetical protein
MVADNPFWGVMDFEVRAADIAKLAYTAVYANLAQAKRCARVGTRYFLLVVV